MCKPSCCPGESRGGFGVLAVIAAAVFVAMIAGPVIHGAEVALRMAAEVAIITALALAGIAVLAAAVFIAIRISRKRRTAAALRLARQPVVTMPTAQVIAQRRGSWPELEASDRLDVSRAVLQHQLCHSCQGAIEPGYPMGGGSYAQRQV